MRARSSKAVLHCAEDVARKILDTYLEPDKSFVELREMAIDGTIDLLHDFSMLAARNSNTFEKSNSGVVRADARRWRLSRRES